MSQACQSDPGVNAKARAVDMESDEPEECKEIQQWALSACNRSDTPSDESGNLHKSRARRLHAQVPTNGSSHRCGRHSTTFLEAVNAYLEKSRLPALRHHVE